ncbi:MAG TPA: NAD(P)H-quinone oxidoreductase [Jatrophihabitantaceae bacterium]|nr:NAD(P)H-quinone oxidoreductase [Jatrophihabitantaceae bacterium]
MRAVVITEPGGPDVLKVEDVPAPEPAPGEVLVDVAASAVNRPDLLQRQGHYPPPPGAPPYPGLECSGTIAALGTGVTSWTVGQRVCALLGGGGYAEQATVPAGQLLPVPVGMSLLEAAALPEVTCTVWSLVFDRGRLLSGEVLLVHGGTSGVGTMAVQLGHRHGATVAVTARSPEKLAACAGLGAHILVNYREEDFVERVREATGGHGADVILDNMGAAYLGRNLAVLAIDGRLVSLGLQGGTKGELDLDRLMSVRGTITTARLRAQPPDRKAAIVAATYAFVWPALETGEVRPVVDSVFDLTDVAAAHRRVESSEHVGKVLLRVAGTIDQ